MHINKFAITASLLLALGLTGCGSDDDTPATPAACVAGEHKVDGKCELIEQAVTCDDGQHEENGICIDDSITCNAGQHEENGSCIDDSISCNDGQHEENGTCVTTPLACAEGQHEVDGSCVALSDNDILVDTLDPNATDPSSEVADTETGPVLVTEGITEEMAPDFGQAAPSQGPN